MAFFIWAIDVDALGLPVTKCWELFQESAVKCQKTYTDPSDELLFCKNVVEMNPIAFFTDYVLFYAKCNVISGIVTYGKYDKLIINYK